MSMQVKSRLELTRVKAMGTAVMLIAVFAIPAAAAGSPQCTSRPEFLKQLSKRFHEEPVALGLTNDGSIIEVLTSDDGSTWTMMISRPNGSSCLIAAGEGREHRCKLAETNRLSVENCKASSSSEGRGHRYLPAPTAHPIR